MCGIVGYISDRHYEQELALAVQEMHHRGPDNQQIQLFESRDRRIGLGHVRLSILDLDPRANQPFSVNDGQYVILFNGEIYNYQSIKENLKSKGVTFTTTSDTEVFIRAYEAFGIDCVKDFRGIFSALIFDIDNEKLFLIRDQIGIKPLYFYNDHNGNIFFASELKSLFKFSATKRKISNSDICQFLNMGFVMEPRTGFENVLKVMPGSYLSIHHGKIDLTTYFEPQIKEEKVSQDIADTVKRATQEQAVADVPVALLYSGGLDSSVLASFLGATTKSLFFKSSKNERESAGLVDDQYYALEIAKKLGLDLELVEPENEKEKDFLSEIEHIALNVEEPISDYTFIASEQLCLKARELGFKVVISGMGGDEGFGGYPRYVLAKNYTLLRKVRNVIKLITPLIARRSTFSKKIQRLISFLYEKTFALGYVRLIGYLSSDEISNLLLDHSHIEDFENSLTEYMAKYESSSHLKQAMMLDYSGFLSHNLIVADKSSMLASVEMRVPLLDPFVYQSGIELDGAKLMSVTNQKLPLQTILFKKIPKNLVSRPKAGFNPPLDLKINKLGEEKILAEFANGLIGNYLNTGPLIKIVKDHFSGSQNNTYKIWQLLFLNAWLRVWTESKV